MPPWAPHRVQPDLKGRVITVARAKGDGPARSREHRQFAAQIRVAAGVAQSGITHCPVLTG